MITTRLKLIFALSIPLFVIHAVEEYLTHFYSLDTFDANLFGYLLGDMTPHQASFFTFETMLILLLIVSAILLISEKARFYMLGFAGFVYLFELSHVVKAFLVGGYYPGVLTALAFPVVAFFFWKEWLKIYSNKKTT